MKTRNDNSLLQGAMQAACCLLVMLSAGTAQAQWRVVDNQGNRELSTIKRAIGTDGNVNNRLQNIYDQQKFSKAEDFSDADNATPEPETPVEGMTKAQVAAMQKMRCPEKKAKGVAKEQTELCKKLVETELAKYRYSLAMYELSKKRQKWLDEIRKDRGNIREDQTGRLQDNTNKLLALLSQIDIDRQQQKVYMDAYDARIAYLTNEMNTKARQALEGTKGGFGANVLGSAAGFATLKTLLNQSKSQRSEHSIRN